MDTDGPMGSLLRATVVEVLSPHGETPPAHLILPLALLIAMGDSGCEDCIPRFRFEWAPGGPDGWNVFTGHESSRPSIPSDATPRP